MARKAVQSGGKKDELIAAALGLFLEKGYDGVSVRMILAQVDGEIGMFYHYFKSKDEIFEAAVDLFLQRYTEGFGRIAREEGQSPVQRLAGLLRHFNAAVDEYNLFLQSTADKFVFPQREALHSRTIDALVPYAEALLGSIAAQYPALERSDISMLETARFIVHGFSGVLNMVNESAPLSAQELERRVHSAACMAAAVLGVPKEEWNAIKKRSE